MCQIDIKIYNNANFSFDQYVSGDQRDGSNVDESGAYTTTQVCGLWHGTMKISDDDHGCLCHANALGMCTEINRSTVGRIRKARDPLCPIDIIGYRRAKLPEALGVL